MACLSVCASQVFADETSSYQRALTLIELEKYDSALVQFLGFEREFSQSRHVSTAKTYIAVLQNSTVADEALPAFFNALALKNQGLIDEAIVEFDAISRVYPLSSLSDDALYMAAYLQVMLRYDFIAANTTLDVLLQRFAHTNYTDSALYLKAIALEQMGDTLAAQKALTDLRDRHTALSLPLNFRWPAGDVVSRYWFDRADRRLAIVKKRIATASVIRDHNTNADGILNLSVNVRGEELLLLLQPSPLTSDTRWLDASFTDQIAPPVGIFDGVVDGKEASWVRVVLHEGTIKGVVNINDEQQRLEPSNLIGTLDYYQPDSRKQAMFSAEYSELAEQLQVLDTLVPPPAIEVSPDNHEIGLQSDIRTVPMSIVIDSQFDRYYAGNGMVNALNSLNVADGIYRQFGLALTLDTALRFDEQSDPMNLGAVTLETILRSFRQFTIKDKAIFEDSVLAYLFTGNPKTDVTLGLAWIDTLCRQDGYDVGVTAPSDFGDVLLTHELGHSFGAQHDSDTQCRDEQSGIMWPNISEKTGAEFTTCSRSQVAKAYAKSCLSNAVDLELTARSSAASIDFMVTNPDSRLTIDTLLHIETSLPDQVQWPEMCDLKTPTSARCRVADVLPREQRAFSLTVHEQFHHLNAPVAAQATLVGYSDLQPFNNTASSALSESKSSGSLVRSIAEGADFQATDSHTAEVPVTGAANSKGSVSALWLLALFILTTARSIITGARLSC